MQASLQEATTSPRAGPPKVAVWLGKSFVPCCQHPTGCGSWCAPAANRWAVGARAVAGAEVPWAAGGGHVQQGQKLCRGSSRATNTMIGGKGPSRGKSSVGAQCAVGAGVARVAGARALLGIMSARAGAAGAWWDWRHLVQQCGHALAGSWGRSSRSESSSDIGSTRGAS